jgi:excisionase family DNA binding protein
MPRVARSIVTREAIAEAFAKAGQADRLVISPEELAAIVGVTKKTIYLWIAKGRLDGSFTKVGKHILIWRDKAIDILFNGPK